MENCKVWRLDIKKVWKRVLKTCKNYKDLEWKYIKIKKTKLQEFGIKPVTEN